MSNVHRFKQRPPPQRRRPPVGEAAWVPWALVLVAAAILVAAGASPSLTPFAAIGVVLTGVFLSRPN